MAAKKKPNKSPSEEKSKLKTMKFQIGLEILILIIGVYLAFFKSYFEEKGKNLATKEDIEQITRSVEVIKNELHQSAEYKWNLKDEQKDAILNCHEKYNKWLNTIMSISMGFNEDEIKKIRNEIDKAKFEYNLAEDMSDLFNENKDIMCKFRNLAIETSKLAAYAEGKLGELNLLLVKLEITERKVLEGELEKYEYRALLEKKYAWQKNSQMKK